ncbi:hypothetical protein K438DRAFT_1785550 [Mycena galopus ATCC 62051]|nr:hypothetical protein K438DRAFT_1785550 [Mycena galopus ATCC 62051]
MPSWCRSFFCFDLVLLQLCNTDTKLQLPLQPRDGFPLPIKQISVDGKGDQVLNRNPESLVVESRRETLRASKLLGCQKTRDLAVVVEIVRSAHSRELSSSAQGKKGGSERLQLASSCTGNNTKTSDFNCQRSHAMTQ